MLKVDLKGISEAVPHVPETHKYRYFYHLIGTEMSLQASEGWEAWLALQRYFLGNKKSRFFCSTKQRGGRRLLVERLNLLGRQASLLPEEGTMS